MTFLKRFLIPIQDWYNDTVYWIDGVSYVKNGWLGCQIQSWRWTRPPAGTTIDLLGESFRIFSTKRNGLVVECNWCLTRLPDNIDEANARIREFYDRLEKHKTWSPGSLSATFSPRKPLTQ